MLQRLSSGNSFRASVGFVDGKGIPRPETVCASGHDMHPRISVTPSPVFWGYLIRVMGFHIEVPGTAIAFEDRIGDHWD